MDSLKIHYAASAGDVSREKKKKKRILLSTSKTDGPQRKNISVIIREEMDMPDQMGFQYSVNFKQKSIYVL